MSGRELLIPWIIEAMESMGGKAHVVDVCKHIWKHHEGDLSELGDLFFTWQYETRWAGAILVKQKLLVKEKNGMWQLLSKAKSAGAKS